jgi:hypothetical protein
VAAAVSDRVRKVIRADEATFWVLVTVFGLAEQSTVTPLLTGPEAQVGVVFKPSVASQQEKPAPCRF